MKTISKFVLAITLLACITIGNAQKMQQEGVSIALDMKPILQMEITSPDQINFVFDKKSKYYSGIVKNAATIIKVTSTVKWDLYAVGRSKGTNPNGKTFWDQEKSYGSTVNSVADIPLSLLEIKQNTSNSGANHKEARYTDYSQDFAEPFRSNGGNSLYVSENGTPSPPSINGKYIAGHAGVSDDINNGYMNSGSYISKNGQGNDFMYVMDYRILPGFPAVFPNAYNADATVAENIVSSAKASSVLVGGAAQSGDKAYAEPGTYTMNVQYVLLEDQ
tara:strand:- start:2806 stop:3633 length:828 start_codon:yes stop_codon:yes gene_type:complete